MTEQEALALMVPPGRVRPNKQQMRGGIIQIMLTRACDRACLHCTQGSNLGGRPAVMPLAQVEQALLSLEGYWGVVAFFGGNPCLHPQFEEACALMRKHVPPAQRGLWSNNPVSPEKARACRATFNPVTSNLNVHGDRAAWDLFRTYWPESRPFGLAEESRHSPVLVAMRDVVPDEAERWRLIAGCDINQSWSALVGAFRGRARAYFCEVAYAQAALHEHEPDYPDTGLPADPGWWRLPMTAFAAQVRKHCHECGVPLRGFGALANDPDAPEAVSEAHRGVPPPKRKGRRVELVTVREQLGPALKSTVDYVGNARRPAADVVRGG